MCGYVSYAVDGVPLWAGDSDGTQEPFHVPFGNGETNATVTVTLAVPSDGGWGRIEFAAVYLLRWSPKVNVLSSYPSPYPVIETPAGGVRHIVTVADDKADLYYELDLSKYPCANVYYGYPYNLPLPAGELAELNNPHMSFAPGLVLFLQMDAYGRGSVSIPSCACVSTINVPDASAPTRLVFIKPEVTRTGPGVPDDPPDPFKPSWPLATGSQKKAWRDTFAAAGESRGTIEVTTGAEGYDLPSDLLTVSIDGVIGASAPLPAPSVGQASPGGGIAPLGTGAPCYYCAPCEADEAQVCIGVGCSTVWDWCDPEPDPDDPGLTHAGDEARDPCGDRCDGDCDPLCSCDSLGSFTFRASLGATPHGTPAGAVWISLDAPQPLTPRSSGSWPRPASSRTPRPRASRSPRTSATPPSRRCPDRRLPQRL